MAVKVLLIDNYDSFTWNVAQMLEQCGVTDLTILKNDKLLSSDTEAFEKVVISPGPEIAREAGELNLFLAQNYARKSILGICLGHEAIAEHFGARLVKLPVPMHGLKGPGIIVREDPIFRGIPRTITIGHYHSWILQKETLPRELIITMEDDIGSVMAIRHRVHDLVGLQFHPESIMTGFGKEMMANWLGIWDLG